MTSIPADPSLAMGNIASQEKIDFLQDIALAELPQKRAQEHLDNLVKLKSVFKDMARMNFDDEYLGQIRMEEAKLKRDIARAALNLGNAAITAQRNIRQIMATRGQQTVMTRFASNVNPLDQEASGLRKPPIATDSLMINVQYFCNDKVKDDDVGDSHTQAIFSFLTEKKYKKGMANSARETMVKNTQFHDIEGTIVIAGTCTHRRAQIIDPFVLEPMKALSSWNEMFPDQRIETRAEDMFRAAMTRRHDGTNNNRPGEATKMRVISGANYSSSFIGMIHIYKQKNTDTIEESQLLADRMKVLFVNSLTAEGQFEEEAYCIGEETVTQVENLVSSSSLQHHCSLVVEGYTPYMTNKTTKNNNSDVATIMKQLDGLQTGVDKQVRNDKSDPQQVLGWNSESVNEMIDGMGSLMANFTDYIQKSINGDCGIPINFYLRDVYADDIAKAYIRKYYPNGAATQRDAIAGQTGQILLQDS